MKLGLQSLVTYHAFAHKLDAGTRLLLENVRVNKRTSGNGPVTCTDVVTICRDALSGQSHTTASPAVAGQAAAASTVAPAASTTATVGSLPPAAAALTGASAVL